MGLDREGGTSPYSGANPTSNVEPSDSPSTANRDLLLLLDRLTLSTMQRSVPSDPSAPTQRPIHASLIGQIVDVTGNCRYHDRYLGGSGGNLSDS